MPRKNITDWCLFGRRYQCTLRSPLVDGEVWPTSDGEWAYEVVSAPKNSVVDAGKCDSLECAKGKVLSIMAELAEGEK